MRFWVNVGQPYLADVIHAEVSTLLEIQPRNTGNAGTAILSPGLFQPFLRFWNVLTKHGLLYGGFRKFQPFLRFYCESETTEKRR